MLFHVHVGWLKNIYTIFKKTCYIIVIILKIIKFLNIFKVFK